MKPLKVLSSLLILLCLVVIFEGCMMHVGMAGRTEHRDGRSVEQTWLKTELIFGLSTPSGDTVTQREWQTFVDEEITPRFKDGFTIIKSSGQWMSPSSHQLVKEPSYIVVFLYKPDHESDRKIEEIRSEYKKQFQQESVLRIDTETDVSF